jgi:hypothetical protein
MFGIIEVILRRLGHSTVLQSAKYYNNLDINDHVKTCYLWKLFAN